VGKKGFPNLKWLNISHNAQFTGQHLEDWVGTGGFANLEVLELENTNLTDKDLEQMIERSPWVRNLKSLNLVDKGSFRRFPSNIFQMKKLTTTSLKGRGPNMMGPARSYQGDGLFVSSLVNGLEVTQEFKALLEADMLDTPYS